MKRLVLQRRFHTHGSFYLEDDWIYLRQVQVAINHATTWGEFEAALPPGEFESLYQWVEMGGEDVYRNAEGLVFGDEDDVDPACGGKIIAHSDAFRGDDLYGWIDGDYPPWIGMMYDKLPSEFTGSYRRKADSFLSGSWDEYPMDQAVEMAEALRPHGFEVRTANDGYWES